MKFSLTITDATQDELFNLARYLNGGIPAPMNSTSSAALTVSASPPQYTATPSDNHQQADAEDGPANPNPPQFDNTGLPWDERIHAKTKAFNADGSWRGRRGVDKSVAAAIEAQLRAGNAPAPQYTAPTAHIPPPDMSQQQPPAYTPPSPPQHPQFTGQPPAQQYQPPQPPAYTPPPQQYAPPPQQYQPPAQPGALPQVPVMDFGTFMQNLTQRMTPGAPLNAGYLASILPRLSQQFGRPVNAITDVAADQNMITYALQIMVADGFWQF